VHPVGFTIEMYHNARSHEHQSTHYSRASPLACCQWTCMTYTWCCMYNLRLLMMDGKTVRNM